MDDKFSDDKPLNKPKPKGELSEHCSEARPHYAPSAESADNSETAVPELQSTMVPDDETSDPPVWHPEVNISRSLKAPKLAHVRPNSITYEQALNGINVQIPGTPAMKFGDNLVFYWGLNKSSTKLLLPSINKQTTVRVLCISYSLMNHQHFGQVELYYEVHRGPFLVGVSPKTRVTVGDGPTPPKAPRQKDHRKAS